MSAIKNVKIIKELKHQFNTLFKAGKLDDVIKILLKYHPVAKKSKIDTQILIVCEQISSEKKRGVFIPLCTLSILKDLERNCRGVGFGIIPRGTFCIRQKNNKRRTVQKL